MALKASRVTAGSSPYAARSLGSAAASLRCERSAEAHSWQKAFHMFAFHRDEWLQHYHRRSNVETTFSMIKRKFGGAVRAKKPEAMANEVLLKCLAHNLSCLVHAIHELGVEPTFWADGRSA